MMFRLSICALLVCFKLSTMLTFHKKVTILPTEQHSSGCKQGMLFRNAVIICRDIRGLFAVPLKLHDMSQHCSKISSAALLEPPHLAHTGTV